MLHEVWPFVDAHRRDGRPVVLARLVGRDGPGARPLGATMAVAADGTWTGSLSGGCVEGIVLDAAAGVLDGAGGQSMVVAPGDQLMPWEDAPACSGRLRVLITPAPGDPVHAAITAALAHDQPLAVRVGLESPYAWSTAATARRLADTEAFVEELPQRLRLPGLHRLAAPAGLDLGGASLADTALSILAGMVAAENGRAGGPLRDGGPAIRAARV
jgi:xanthine dehydrogenase accessory factor